MSQKTQLSTSVSRVSNQEMAQSVENQQRNGLDVKAMIRDNRSMDRANRDQSNGPRNSGALSQTQSMLVNPNIFLH